MGGTPNIIKCENVLQQITWISTTATPMNAVGFQCWILIMNMGQKLARTASTQQCVGVGFVPIESVPFFFLLNNWKT